MMFRPIITSANSLPNYCKTENVWAMSRAIRKYGTYPLDPHLLDRKQKR